MNWLVVRGSSNFVGCQMIGRCGWSHFVHSGVQNKKNHGAKAKYVSVEKTKMANKMARSHSFIAYPIQTSDSILMRNASKDAYLCRLHFPGYVHFLIWRTFCNYLTILDYILAIRSSSAANAKFRFYHEYIFSDTGVRTTKRILFQQCYRF